MSDYNESNNDSENWKRKTNIVIIVFIFIIALAPATVLLYMTISRKHLAPKIVFSKGFGDLVYNITKKIQQTIDGGYIVVSTIYFDSENVFGNHGKSDFLVMKLDKTGNVEWFKCFGGSEYEHAGDIQQTIDGGYIVVDTTES